MPGLGTGAHVVNVVSIAGLVAVGPYSASKHAQLAFSRSTAVELGRLGISVHTVSPGFVETPGFPQHRRLGVFPQVVASPELVATRILEAVQHDRREILVPRWYLPAAWVQALAPGALARTWARFGPRDLPRRSRPLALESARWIAGRRSLATRPRCARRDGMRAVRDGLRGGGRRRLASPFARKAPTQPREHIARAGGRERRGAVTRTDEHALARSRDQRVGPFQHHRRPENLEAAP